MSQVFILHVNAVYPSKCSWTQKMYGWNVCLLLSASHSSHLSNHLSASSLHPYPPFSYLPPFVCIPLPPSVYIPLPPSVYIRLPPPCFSIPFPPLVSIPLSPPLVSVPSLHYQSLFPSLIPWSLFLPSLNDLWCCIQNSSSCASRQVGQDVLSI